MNTFRDAMRSKDFVVTAGLPVGGGTTAMELQRQLDVLAGCVDAVQVDPDRGAEGPLDALAVAVLAQRHALDTVVHLTCRDRNRLALKSAMQGLAAVGVGSVVLARGQKLPDELRGKVKGVFDTTTLQLIEMARHIGETGDGLFTGSRVSVIRPAGDWTAAEASKRIGAGVRFLQTLPCLNARVLTVYMDRLVALRIPRRAAVVVDVPVLASADAIATIKAQYPGCRIPAGIARRLAGTADPSSEGIAIAAEMLAACRRLPGVSGVNLMGWQDASSVADAIQKAV